MVFVRCGGFFFYLSKVHYSPKKTEGTLLSKKIANLTKTNKCEPSWDPRSTLSVHCTGRNPSIQSTEQKKIPTPPGSPETSRMLVQYAATLPLTTVKLNLLWWEVNLKMSPNVPSPYVSLIHNYYYYYYAWAITSSLDKTIIFIGLV